MSLAVKKFEEYRKVNDKVEQHWFNLVDYKQVAQSVRPIIASSWERCLREGTSPMRMAADDPLNNNDLAEHREKNNFLLQVSRPYMEQLFEQFEDSFALLMLADATGMTLDGCGTKKVWDHVENINFVPGANWSEIGAGTNAIGTAITERRPAQVFANEHFCQGWHHLICSASPIHDPLTNEIIGVLDLTGEKNLVPVHNLHLVIHQAKKIENHIRNHLQQSHPLIFDKIVNLVNTPIAIFDKKGHITKRNQIGKRYFDIQDSIDDILQEQIMYELREHSSRKIVIPCTINNERFKVKLLAHVIEDAYYGGVAIFEHDKIIRPPSTIEAKIPSKKSQQKYSFNSIITKDRAMLDVIEKAKKVAEMNRDVLITGGSGVGKEVLVQAIHQASLRASQPFVAVNCGALPQELLASELFGHVAGAFTGAHPKGKKGKFVYANKGTLFLDEIGELPPDAQAYLLRVLEEREVTPLGGNKSIPIDVNVISATNRNLLEEVEKGNFREDLYYRIHVLHLPIPSLKERSGDVVHLIEHFLQQMNMTQYSFTDDALEALREYDWPGNIRQLKNVINQAMLNDNDEVIDVEDLPDEIKINVNKDHPEKIVNMEPRMLTEENLLGVLDKTDYNISQTARIFQVSRTTIYNKLTEFKIEIRD